MINSQRIKIHQEANHLVTPVRNGCVRSTQVPFQLLIFENFVESIRHRAGMSSQSNQGMQASSNDRRSNEQRYVPKRKKTKSTRGCFDLLTNRVGYKLTMTRGPCPKAKKLVHESANLHDREGIQVPCPQGECFRSSNWVRDPDEDQAM